MACNLCLILLHGNNQDAEAGASHCGVEEVGGLYDMTAPFWTVQLKAAQSLHPITMKSKFTNTFRKVKKILLFFSNI